MIQFDNFFLINGLVQPPTRISGVFCIPIENGRRFEASTQYPFVTGQFMISNLKDLNATVISSLQDENHQHWDLYGSGGMSPIKTSKYLKHNVKPRNVFGFLGALSQSREPCSVYLKKWNLPHFPGPGPLKLVRQERTEALWAKGKQVFGWKNRAVQLVVYGTIQCIW